MNRQPYPSDISREQFEEIRPLLESVRKKTKPRTVDLYEVFCGLLYVLSSGCQWRMIPRDFPKWTTIYTYYSKWKKADDDVPSILEQILKKISWRDPYQTGAERYN